MLYLIENYYYVSLILQAICAIHCIRKGNQGKWIWLIIFLPVIGSLAYIFSEMFTRNEMEIVQDGVGQVFNPNGKIKKLQANLRFSDTFQNRIALADAYLAAGQAAQAIELYETSLNGNFTDHEHGNMQLMQAYFLQKDFQKVVTTADKIKHLPQFARSKAHMMYAIALGYTGYATEAEQAFQSLNSRFANYECRYQYALMMERQGRLADAKKQLQTIVGEADHINGAEKRTARPWINQAREALKRMG